MFSKRSDSAFDCERNVYFFIVDAQVNCVSVKSWPSIRTSQKRYYPTVRRGLLGPLAQMAETRLMFKGFSRHKLERRFPLSSHLRCMLFPSRVHLRECGVLMRFVQVGTKPWRFLARAKRIKRTDAAIGLSQGRIVTPWCVFVCCLTWNFVSCHGLDLRDLLQATRLVQIKHRGPKGFGVRLFRQKLMISGHEAKWLLEIWIIFGRAW